MGFGNKKVGLRYRMGVGSRFGMVFSKGFGMGFNMGLGIRLTQEKFRLLHVESQKGKYRKTELGLVNTMTKSMIYQNYEVIL